MDRSTVATKYWHRTEDGRVQCDVCPRACRLQEGQRGFCFVRMRQGNAVVLTTYGRSSGYCVDPVEKKPLNHFLPGSPVLSFGTAGCNLGCRFCQNWDISKSRETDTAAHAAGDAGPGPAYRARQRRPLRLYRQRPRPGGPEHPLPRVRGTGDRARLVPAGDLAAHRRWPVRELRHPPAGGVRRSPRGTGGLGGCRYGWPLPPRPPSSAGLFSWPLQLASPASPSG